MFLNINNNKEEQNINIERSKEFMKNQSNKTKNKKKVS